MFEIRQKKKKHNFFFQISTVTLPERELQIPCLYMFLSFYVQRIFIFLCSICFYLSMYNKFLSFYVQYVSVFLCTCFLFSIYMFLSFYEHVSVFLYTTYFYLSIYMLLSFYVQHVSIFLSNRKKKECVKWKYIVIPFLHSL